MRNASRVDSVIDIYELVWNYESTGDGQDDKMIIHFHALYSLSLSLSLSLTHTHTLSHTLSLSLTLSLSHYSLTRRSSFVVRRRPPLAPPTAHCPLPARA